MLLYDMKLIRTKKKTNNDYDDEFYELLIKLVSFQMKLDIINNGKVYCT